MDFYGIGANEVGAALQRAVAERVEHRERVKAFEAAVNAAMAQHGVRVVPAVKMEIVPKVPGLVAASGKAVSVKMFEEALGALEEEYGLVLLAVGSLAVGRKAEK